MNCKKKKRQIKSTQKLRKELKLCQPITIYRFDMDLIQTVKNNLQNNQGYVKARSILNDIKK